MKTIAIPEELHREIMQIKLNKGEKNTAQIIREFILAYKEKNSKNILLSLEKC